MKTTMDPLTEKTIVLFMGPHRSGSRYMRDEVFPYLEDVFDVCTRDFEFIRLLVEAVTETPGAINIENIRSLVRERFKGVEEKIIIISDPDLFGSYDDPASRQFSDSGYKAENLARIFCGAKIFLTPRRQDTWIESYYRSWLRGYSSVTMQQFIAPHPEPGAKPNRPWCDTTALDWGNYVENYMRLFGKENVFVMPYEVLQKDTDDALNSIFAFLKVKPYHPEKFVQVNRSYSALSCRIALLLNRFVHSRENPFGFIPDCPFLDYFLERREGSTFFRILAGISRRLCLAWFLFEVVDKVTYRKPDLLGPENRNRIMEYYRDKNKSYEKLIGIDLSEYGYY